ncbi:MAG: hypothetical protein H6861_07325 [Rhodospirillales bacterium]|nr:hypothetical protein [Rhodospirillales bacterium]
MKKEEYPIFTALKHWVEGHFNTVLILCFVVGMFSPWVSAVPSYAVFLLLGGALYFSCARLTVRELRQIRVRQAVSFYIVRFICLPFALYGLSALFLPEYKYAILLLGLIPAGASVPSLVGILGGNVTLSLGYTVVSSLLAPFIIPPAFALIGHGDVELDVWHMFYTLCGIIFIPVFLYFVLTRPFAGFKQVVQANARFGSVALVGVMIILVVGQQREGILSDPWFLIQAMPVLFGVYFVFYLFGWLFPYNGNTGNRIAHTVCSGAMNNGLAIGIAVVYFSPQMALLMVLTEVPWVLGLPLFKTFLQWHKNKQQEL